ncbi:MAG: sugar phosphate isomerase/epimerase, partial [Planctomycetes bacterium]|nr:sugar phosphate isomerase/epimerase [Planctomycetota bacterium]
AEALKTCAKIGYDSVELVSTKGWPCDPQVLSSKARKEIRGQLQDLNLKLPALMENLHVVVDEKQHRINLDRIQAAGELGHDLSPEHPPVVETVLGGKPQQWEQMKSKMVAGLKGWAKSARKAKTVIAIKAHVGGALHTPDDANWLVNEVDSPWIKLAYDFSHFQLRGFDLKKSLQAMIDQSVFIHVKDKTGDAEKFQFLLPGDGDIDYATYFQLLKKSSYQGDVVVEVSGQIHGKPGYDPARAAKRSYANLAPVLRKAGLRTSD